MAAESETGVLDNHAKVITIHLHLLLCPLSLVDGADGVAMPVSLKKPFLSLPALTERERERGRGGKMVEEKSRQRHFSAWLFVNFRVLVKNERQRQCPVARLVEELLSREGLAFECVESVRDELLKRDSMLL